ncbi:MAG: VanW family protein [Armatimonadota bacterium]|nr:VanW family protein [Armatimonadota bacterium]
MSLSPDSKLPTRSQALIFNSKVKVLRFRRSIQNAVRPVPRLAHSGSTAEHVIAASATPLWSENDPSEQRLQLGKVHNLRLVCRAIDGLVLRPDEVFSFWRQVGNPSRRRGFVPGRQIQEGCVIPAIGGGICQLSNALYACALDSGCEVVERHPHTRALSAASWSLGRDATVAWNHIDLRFRASIPIKIQAKLTGDQLDVKFLSDGRAQVAKDSVRGLRLIQDAESCETCGQGGCFRHGTLDRNELRPKTAFVVNQVWPEFALYMKENRAVSDPVFAPVDGTRRHRPRYAWPTDGAANEALLLYLFKGLRCRSLQGAALRSATMEFEACFADDLGRRMPFDAQHCVVSLSLLPHLWRSGWLGGRSFDVIADRLPIAELQSLLDGAYESHPERGLLADFRAPAAVAEAEIEALAAADHIITPSAYVAEVFGDRAVLLTWSTPAMLDLTRGDRIAFPGPTAARKGAYEVREVARRLGLTIALSGSELEGAGFWEGVSTIRAGPNWMHGCRAVLHPAIVEEQPRKLLQAIASGLPVIATEVCGLGAREGVTTVPAGDIDALVSAIVNL